jgi:uncharacterized integral membrane protein (TIGR00698 family)
VRCQINSKTSLIEEVLLGCSIQEAPRLIPGILLVLGIVAAAILVADWLNEAVGVTGVVSYILVAIVFGMVVRNAFGLAPSLRLGVFFCIRKLLRLGIILLGIRFSIVDVAIIGVWGVPIVISCISAGLLSTIYLTRLLRLSYRLGTLIAIGTSICGASAIVAAAPTIEASDEEVTYAIANITIFGLIAMVVYPYVAKVLFDGNLVQIGLFIGTAIHETAQVAGAGLIYDQSFNISEKPSVTDIAVVIKLIRNLMMVLVIPAMAFLYAQRTLVREKSSGRSFREILNLAPVFIIGFLLAAITRSIGDTNLYNGHLAFGLWNTVDWLIMCNGIKELSGYVLSMAMAGVGLSTSFAAVKGLGIKPFAVGLISATMVGATSVVSVIILGPLVKI